MKSKKKWIGLVLVLVLVYSLVQYFNLSEILTIENLKANQLRLSVYIEQHFIQSALLYIILYIILIALNIPGGAIMTLAGGALFGLLPAVIFVNIAATVGGTIGFVIARKFFGVLIQDRYKDKLTRFNEEINTHGKNYLLTLRLIPIFPFFFVNIAAGLTMIPLKTFVWTTSLGTLPGTFAYVFAGYNIGNIVAGQPILSVEVILALVALGVMSTLPTILTKIKK